MERLLRAKAVIERTGLARSTIYLHAKQGLFPPPVKIGMNVAAWPEQEIRHVMEARIAGKTEDEIRNIVARIIRERTGLAA